MFKNLSLMGLPLLVYCTAQAVLKIPLLINYSVHLAILLSLLVLLSWIYEVRALTHKLGYALRVRRYLTELGYAPLAWSKALLLPILNADELDLRVAIIKSETLTQTETITFLSSK